jgi:putative hemolysin
MEPREQLCASCKPARSETKRALETAPTTSRFPAGVGKIYGKIYGSDDTSGAISAVGVNTLPRVTIIKTGAGTKPHHMDSNRYGTSTWIRRRCTIAGTTPVAPTA